MADAAKQVEPVLLIAVGAIAELDWRVSRSIRPRAKVALTAFSLVALASAAQRYSLIKPLMVEEPVLEIQDGRHLLHEQLVETYVHNDTLLYGGFPGEDNGLRSMVSFCKPIVDGCRLMVRWLSPVRMVLGNPRTASRWRSWPLWLRLAATYLPWTPRLGSWTKVSTLCSPRGPHLTVQVFTRVHTKESSSKACAGVSRDVPCFVLTISARLGVHDRSRSNLVGPASRHLQVAYHSGRVRKR